MNGKSRGKKGVSPVIGVILMVAATIVIAAVVMAMLGGFKAPSTVPTVSLSAENYVETSAPDIIIKHNGGDTLSANDFQVSIVPAGSVPKYLTMGGTDFAAGNVIIATHQTNNCGDGTYNLSANNWILKNTDPNTGSDPLVDGQKYEVKVKHVGSGAILLDTVVTVRGT